MKFILNKKGITLHYKKDDDGSGTKDSDYGSDTGI